MDPKTGGISGGARLRGSITSRLESFTVVAVQYGLIRMRDIPDGRAMAEDVCFFSSRCDDDASAGDVGGARVGVGAEDPPPEEVPTSARDVPQRLAASGEVHRHPEQSIVIRSNTIYCFKFHKCKINFVNRY